MSQTQTYYGQQSRTHIPPAAPSPILQNIYGNTFANINPHRSARCSSGIFSLHALDLNINFGNNDNPPETPSWTCCTTAPATLPVQEEEEEDNREDNLPQPPSRGSGGNPCDNSPDHPGPSGGDPDPEDDPSGPPGGGPPDGDPPGGGPPGVVLLVVVLLVMILLVVVPLGVVLLLALVAVRKDLLAADARSLTTSIVNS
ncbi:hypothetical protein VKT23_003034 [Stygiomarasmius scandens]|uniref:Uncharacterized protein n=1 Tax=Marasmiellus scandens TaxID=2682957 RepID=A0ABR1JZ27_9AGAR